MTNANVDTVGGIDQSGRDLKLSYKGGSNSVIVPENVPIVTFPAGAPHRSDGVSKKVFVVAAPGQGRQYAAQRIVVEKDGVAPPMYDAVPPTRSAGRSAVPSMLVPVFLACTA